MLVFHVFPCLITLGGVVIMLMGELFLNRTGLGWGGVIPLGAVQAHVSRSARFC